MQHEFKNSGQGPHYYNTPGWTRRQRDRAGRLSHGCIAWLIGLPLPIVILAFLWRGCD